MKRADIDAALENTIWFYRRAPRPAAAVPFIDGGARTITTPPFLNISTRRVGGLRFVKLGRFCVAFCITREFKPL